MTRRTWLGTLRGRSQQKQQQEDYERKPGKRTLNKKVDEPNQAVSKVSAFRKVHSTRMGLNPPPTQILSTRSLQLGV